MKSSSKEGIKLKRNNAQFKLLKKVKRNEAKLSANKENEISN